MDNMLPKVQRDWIQGKMQWAIRAMQKVTITFYISPFAPHLLRIPL
jgi:hypothetical protein